MDGSMLKNCFDQAVVSFRSFTSENNSKTKSISDASEISCNFLFDIYETKKGIFLYRRGLMSIWISLSQSEQGNYSVRVECNHPNDYIETLAIFQDISKDNQHGSMLAFLNEFIPMYNVADESVNKNLFIIEYMKKHDVLNLFLWIIKRARFSYCD